MDTLHRSSGNRLLPAVAAFALAGTIVSITIAMQQTGIGRPTQGASQAVASSAPILPAAASNPAQQAAAAPVSPFSRDGDALRIRAKGMRRTLAVEHLARLTRARVVAGTQWLALAPDLDLDWQGSDPAEAWKLVLGSELRHTVICERDGCTVRILSIDVDGGSVTVAEAAQPVSAALPVEPAGLMNRPTHPDAIDETSLGP